MDMTTGMDLRHTALGNRRARHGNRAVRLSLAAVLLTCLSCSKSDQAEYLTDLNRSYTNMPEAGMLYEPGRNVHLQLKLSR